MAKNHPYASLKNNEVPRNGAFLGNDDFGYPLVDRIETLLYPPHSGGTMEVIPQKIVIHPQVIGRVKDEDIVGKPREVRDDLGVTEEILTLKPEAIERIVDGVVRHFGR